MDKLFKLLLAAAAALFFTGCYSDYLNPGPARVYTRADFEAKMCIRDRYSTSAADDVYQTGHNLVWPEIPARKSDDAYVYVCLLYTSRCV